MYVEAETLSLALHSSMSISFILIKILCSILFSCIFCNLSRQKYLAKKCLLYLNLSPQTVLQKSISILLEGLMTSLRRQYIPFKCVPQRHDISAISVTSGAANIIPT